MMVVQMDLKREGIVLEMVEKKTYLLIVVVGQEILEVHLWMFEE
jgi:hypothetical protein